MRAFWSQNHNVVSVAEVETPEEPEEVGTMPGILVVYEKHRFSSPKSRYSQTFGKHPKHEKN